MTVADPIILYLLMRTDLASMNPGKACAQAHHAGTQLARSAMSEDDAYREWLEQTGSYGTVLTFGVDLATLNNMCNVALSFGLTAGLVYDPSYPIRDGQVTHTLPLVTCGYILARKSLVGFLGNLQLMY